MTELLTEFDKIFPLAESCKFHLLNTLKEHIIPRKHYLLKIGQICRRIYFVQEGVIYGHRIIGEKEICSQLVPKHRMVYAAQSFITQSPTEEALQAIEDSVLYSLSHEEYQRILKIHPEFIFVVEAYIRNELADCQERLFAFQALEPHGAYQWLIYRHPDLIHRLPVKYLARYIGVKLNVFNTLKNNHLSKSKPS
ncbi:MAG TPA: cyclic nucleotide-binding domain-containing protein [Puia sp.]